MDLSFIPSRAAKAASDASGAPRGRALGVALFIVAYIAATAFVAEADLGVRSLVLVAAVFGVLAISLDLVAGMLGLYSLGQGGFFGIGAYLTTIVINNYEWSPFLTLLGVLAVTGAVGVVVGAISVSMQTGKESGSEALARVLPVLQETASLLRAVV